jgi:hypothetical protein
VLVANIFSKIRRESPINAGCNNILQSIKIFVAKTILPNTLNELEFYANLKIKKRKGKEKS